MTDVKQKGFILISLVLIVSFVAVAISSTVAILAINNAQSTMSNSKAEDSLNLAEGCMEDALIKTQAADDYNGGNISRPEGTCNISISKNNTVWTITAATDNTTYPRSVRAVINRTVPTITITSWQEI